MSNVRVQGGPIEDLNASLLFHNASNANAFFEEDMKAIAAGWNPMSLKRGICVYVEPLLELHDPEQFVSDSSLGSTATLRRSSPPYTLGVFAA